MTSPAPSRPIRTLLDAYRAGLFPMADPRTGRIDWYNPDPRAFIPLEPGGFHVSRSLARRVRSGRFVATTDLAFEEVVRCCGEERPERPESWIDDRIVESYTDLHGQGYAHSVEMWLPGAPPPGADARLDLVGGVYGVAIGAAFFAESMFCRPERGGTDASKVALVHLVSHLRRRGFTLLDVQFRNPHIDQFGVVEIRRARYLRLLAEAVDQPREWLPFEPWAVSW
jgi:leucyl/phenylalanyl-tRNA--protein transferase